MAKRVRRKNDQLLRWASAGALALATFAALQAMSFRPLWGSLLFAGAAGLLTLAAVDLGVLTTIIAVALPLTAADPVIGIAFIVLGIASIRYLGADGGAVALLIAGGVAGAIAGPVWVIPALAGVVLGASEGALAAALACAGVEMLGLLTGKERLFGLVTGGSDATRLLDFASDKVPQSLFAAGWLQETFSGFGSETIDRVAAAFGSADRPLVLVIQPLLWAAGAIVAGVIAREARRRRNPLLSAVAALGGVSVPAIGAVVLGSGATAFAYALPFASSLLVAGLLAWVWDRHFPLQVIPDARAAAAPASMAAEDADVDELLRLISTAEERLATEHTTTKIVMITDMKAFSKMTEEDGSVVTAKAIQKHRDLLLPIIERFGGHGKSTGGDGLVAAFDSPAGALQAAAEMQRVLDRHNETHPGDREMTVRIGVADGEVVLDKGGRPFIGAALNLAARIMNLADGGQAFATAEVASKASGAVRTAPLGEFELKNIAKPVPVVEVLWSDSLAE